MTDNKKIRGKADRRRVSLAQRHEREYLVHDLETAAMAFSRGIQALERACQRLRAGFPAKRARK